MNLLGKIKLAVNHPKTAYKFFIKDYLKKDNYYLFNFPLQITFFLTEKCNLRCSMCHVRDSREKFLEKSQSQELDIKLLEKVFKECRNFGPIIQLVGGEPLLYPDFLKLLGIAKKNNLIRSITTNGVLLEKYSKDIIDSGLEFLAVSLDSGDSAVHDRVRGVMNTFEKAIRGLRSILSLRGKSFTPHVNIRTVISRENLDTFDKVFDKTEDLGADEWSLSQFFFYPKWIKEANDNFYEKNNTGEDVWGMPIEGNEYFTKGQIRKLEEKLKDLKNRIEKSKTKVSIQEVDDLDSYYSGKALSRDSFCNSPFWQIFIRQNGDIELCQGYIIGNIKNMKIKEAWDSEKAMYFREVIKKTKITPACFRCCAMNKFKFNQ